MSRPTDDYDELLREMMYAELEYAYADCAARAHQRTQQMRATQREYITRTDQGLSDMDGPTRPDRH